MKKLLLVLFSFCLFGQAFAEDNAYSYSWGKVYGTESNESPGRIKINNDGDVFIFGNFTSNVNSVMSTKYDDLVTEGAPYTFNTGGSNNNLALYKTDLSGNVTWAVSTNRGDISINSCSMTTTADGGVLISLKVRATRGLENTGLGENDTICRFVGTDGIETPVLGYTTSSAYGKYRGVIAKFDKDGICKWAQSFKTSDTNGDVDVYDITEDADGNIYVAGKFISEITFPAQSAVSARNGTTGDGFIVKLDDAGAYVWHFVISGEVVSSEKITQIEAYEDALYFLSNAQGDGAKKINYGNVEVTPSTGSDLFVGKISNMGAIEWVKQYTAGKAITSNTLSIAGGKLYAGGSFTTSISDGANAIETWKGQDGTVNNYAYNQGWLLKFDLATVSTESLKAINGPYTEIGGLRYYQGELYAFGYYCNGFNYTANGTYGDTDFGDGFVILNETGTVNNYGDAFLARYDAGDFTTLSVENIVKGASYETSAGGCDLYDNKLICFGRSQSASVYIYGNEFTTIADSKYNNFLAAFDLEEKSNSIENNTSQTGKPNICIKDAVLHVDGERIASVEVYGISGNIVVKSVYPQGQNHAEFSLTGLPKGIYLVKTCSSNGNIETAKIIF